MQMCAPALMDEGYRAPSSRPSDPERGGGAGTSAAGGGGKPRRRDAAAGGDELRHPLLGDAPTLRMLPKRDEITGFRRPTLGHRDAEEGGGGRRPGAAFKTLARLLGWEVDPERLPLRASPMRIEPKTFFANERTFLSWLHMAVTLGSVAAALLGFAGATPDEAAAGQAPSHMVELIALILLPVRPAPPPRAPFVCCFPAFLRALLPAAAPQRPSPPPRLPQNTQNNEKRKRRRRWRWPCAATRS